MPQFDHSNEDHKRIAELAMRLEITARAIVDKDPYLDDPNRALHVRRTRLRGQLKDLDEFQELELRCGTILGTYTNY